MTIDKSATRFRPTTMYADRAITDTLFQGESQSGLRRNTPTAGRYRSGETAVHLFIRETEQGAPPHLYAGPMTCLSDEGERPVRFRWELRHPLPPDVFHCAKVTAG